MEEGSGGEKGVVGMWAWPHSLVCRYAFTSGCSVDATPENVAMVCAHAMHETSISAKQRQCSVGLCGEGDCGGEYRSDAVGE